MLQNISGWLFERNGAIGRYFKITLTIILLSGLVVCVILASIDLIPISPLIPISLKQPT